MKKGYWITVYRSVSDQTLLERYAKVAREAIEQHGGRFLAGGKPVASYEAGSNERLVIIEFESAAKAVAAYESPEYQEALAILDSSATRDVRIVEGA